MLEAIVALVLIGSIGVALFSWINGNISALTRCHDNNIKSEATINILEYMRTVNPMLRPAGNAQLGGYEINWQAEQKIPVVDKPSSYYQFGLYNTQIKVTMLNGKAWFNLTVQQVGYKKIRSASEEG